MAASAVGALGSAFSGGGGKGGGGGGASGQIPGFYGRAAAPLGRDIRFATKFQPGRYNFDSSGSLLDTAHREPGRRGDPFSANQRAMAESLNFFSNLYNNPDIEAAFDVYRNQARVPGAGEALVSDPLFATLRERGYAQALEASRRTGGLYSTNAQLSLGRTENELLGQQRIYEDTRAKEAAGLLSGLTMARGQAGFFPTQALTGALATLGGGTQFAPYPPGQSNSKGQIGQALGAGGGAYLGNKSG